MLILSLFINKMEDIRGLVRLGMPGNEKPKMGELNKFFTKYCGHWRSIGYKLGLEDSTLNLIQSNYSTDEKERFRVTLQKWLQQDTRATWITLELAITNARREEQSLEPLKEMPVQPPNDHSKSKQNGDKSQERHPAIKERKSISTSNLSANFSSCVMTIRKMLEEKCDGDELQLCKEFCSNLTTGNPDVMLFSDEQLDKMDKCTTFKQLFRILRWHWSWDNYFILKHIITICDSEEAEVELDKFEKLKVSHLGMNLISKESLPAEMLKNYAKLCFTIKKNYKSLTLQDFGELKEFIFKHLGVEEYIALPLTEFWFDSLHLAWYIPMQAVSHIIKMIHLNKRVLIKNSIVLIKIGDKSVLDVENGLLYYDDQLDSPVEAHVSAFPISKEHSHVVCPICSELFKNPKYLPCYHSYCEKCLDKIQEHSMIICPNCKTEALVPHGEVKHLPNNYFMDNLVNKLILKYKLENETEMRCEECKEVDPVIVYCTDCKLLLCCYCKEAHKYIKCHRSHNLISLTELRTNEDLIQSKSKFPTCQEHDVELEYYCETCEKLVCWQCSREHEDHKYDVVKKFADKYQNELQEITSSVDITIKNLSKLQDSIEDGRMAIRHQGDELSKEIDLYYDEAIKKLLEQKEQIKQQVYDTISEKEKAMTTQLQKVIQTQEDILKIKRIRDTLQTNYDQEVVSAKNHLTGSMKKVTEQCEEIGTGPVESANINVTPINEPLPQIVKHSTTNDSLLFEVKNLNKSVQHGQTTTLEVITKDNKGNYYPRGGCEVTTKAVETKAAKEITAKATNNSDGTYLIYFAAQQVGTVDLSACVKPRKIITSDNFGRPWGIACGNNGNWAIADWIKNCVHVFDNQDRPIKKVGIQGSKNEQFKYPCGVAFDDNNELYVTICYNHRVQKFDSNGNYLLQFGGKGIRKGKLNHPVGITSHQDKVYVADRENNRISVFQNDGKFCSIIGEGQLSNRFDIAVNINSEILAADWGLCCVCIFTLGGHYIGNISLRMETGRLELRDPCSLTTDSNGYILIADTSMYNHCISIFDKIGNCICSFGSKGSNDGQFKFPRGIAVGCNGNIYISDGGNNRVQIFPPFT